MLRHAAVGISARELRFGVETGVAVATRWAKVRWSPRFEPMRAFADRAGLQARQEGEYWRVCLDEQYRGQRPGLVRVEGLIGPNGEEDGSRAIGAVGRWPARPDATPEVQEEIDAALARGRTLIERDDLPSVLDGLRSLLRAVDHDTLSFFVERTIPETLSRCLDDWRLCVISLDNRVDARVAMARLLFAQAHSSPELASEDPRSAFRAMQGLRGGAHLGHSTLLDPLLACRWPWVLGVPLFRIPGGIIVVVSGEAQHARGEASTVELADLFTADLLHDQAPTASPDRRGFSVDGLIAAIGWWADRVDRFLGRVLDPTLFTDRDGDYLPESHLGFILSIDRLFASVMATLVNDGRDEYSRRLHLFEALDLLEGLGQGDYDLTLRLSRLQALLDHLHGGMPDDVASVVMPRCERAVAALKALQDGFSRHRTSDGGVASTGRDGQPETLSLEKATSLYLRMVRNAGHSLQREVTRPRSVSLLASHDGQIPPAVSDLAFLHLVALLVDTDQVVQPLLRRTGT